MHKHDCQEPTSVDREWARAEGILERQADTTNGADRRSFTPRKLAHVRMLHCVTKSHPNT